MWKLQKSATTYKLFLHPLCQNNWKQLESFNRQFDNPEFKSLNQSEYGKELPKKKCSDRLKLANNRQTFYPNICQASSNLHALDLSPTPTLTVLGVRTDSSIRWLFRNLWWHNRWFIHTVWALVVEKEYIICLKHILKRVNGDMFIECACIALLVNLTWTLPCTEKHCSSALGKPLLADLSLTWVAVLLATHWDKLSIKCALREDKRSLTHPAFMGGQSKTDVVYRRFTVLLIQFPGSMATDTH